MMKNPSYKGYSYGPIYNQYFQEHNFGIAFPNQ